MALSKAKLREILSGAGVDAEHMSDALTEILDAHTASIDAVKEERDRFKEDADKLTKVQKELDLIKEEAEKNDGKNPYKVKYEALKEEYDAFKKDVNAKENKSKKSDAYKNLLKEAGVSEKRLDAVLRVSDVDKLEFDEEGNLKDKDELIRSIKEEWSDFIQTEQKKGVDTPTPPANNGGGRKTKEEIMAIKDTAERQRVMMENKDLFL